MCSFCVERSQAQANTDLTTDLTPEKFRDALGLSALGMEGARRAKLEALRAFSIGMRNRLKSLVLQLLYENRGVSDCSLQEDEVAHPLLMIIESEFYGAIRELEKPKGKKDG